MPSNSFGQCFRVTTWGESHGPAIGAVIDGCPAGLAIDASDIQACLDERMTGQSAYTTPRKEKDSVQLYSGVFEGKTTGAPISLVIYNHDADSSKYEPIKAVLRPGHANFTYLEKYGCFDYRGGGRASARETACRVMAGAVAKQLLQAHRIRVFAYLSAVGPIKMPHTSASIEALVESKKNSIIRCPDEALSQQMCALLDKTKSQGDSLGGVVRFIIEGLPVGLGDPIYEKLEANLAKALMSLPATKGFEIGEGFEAARLTGSAHNDLFTQHEDRILTRSNHAGGTLGGISTGMPLYGQVAFKPTSSIQKTQESCTKEGAPATFTLPEGSRHDPCVAIRAVPVVEAMCALVLADALLMDRMSRL